MNSDAERCAEVEKFRKIDGAFRTGDLMALKEAVDDPTNFPNGPMPLTIGDCLVYAIYHSPLPFIRTLLEAGAEPNPSHDDGFPPLIAALSCSRSHPGSPSRPDVAEIIELLLSFGADPDQRGINDYTALHMAVSERNATAVGLLLRAGANPRLRTRIDDYEEVSLKLGERMVVAGLEYGIEGMQIGGTRRVEVPPHLGYGEIGVPGSVPANAVLIFQVELLAILNR